MRTPLVAVEVAETAGMVEVIVRKGDRLVRNFYLGSVGEIAAAVDALVRANLAATGPEWLTTGPGGVVVTGWVERVDENAYSVAA